MKTRLRWLRWLRPRRPRLRGLARALAVITLVLALFSSPAVAFYDDPGLNGIASRLAGKKVQVRCLTPEEGAQDLNIVMGASGYVEGWIDPTGRWHPKPWTVFAPGICEDLWAIADGDLSGRVFFDAVWAVMVITHEAGHLKGARWSYSEALTHCWALRHMKSTLNQLGVHAPEVQSFYVDVAVDITEKAMDPEYHDKRCWPR